MFKSLIIISLSFLLSACGFESDDNTPPVITLIGDESITLDINTDPTGIIPFITSTGNSYVVTDNMPGDFNHLDPIIKDAEGDVTTNIDLLNEGSYIITYSVSDESDNSTSAERELVISDITAPLLTVPQMHPAPTPVPEDPTSILLPRNQIFKYQDLKTNVSMSDVWYSLGGIPSLNPVEPTMDISISPSPIYVDNNQSGSSGFSFDYDGFYTATYTVTDKNFNTTTHTRNLEVREDITAPELVSYPPLEHFPFENEIENGYQVSQDNIELIKKLLTTQGLVVSDDFYPYNIFTGYLGDLSDIVVTIPEENPIFSTNFLDQYLTTSTPPGGVDIPIIVSDKSGNISTVYKRKLIIVDQEPPLLVDFPELAAGALNVELDASLTLEDIKQKIIGLSSNPADPDNLVVFVDNEVIDIPLMIESIKDANGNDALDSDNSLNFSALSLALPLRVTYTVFDGYNYPSNPASERTRDLTLYDNTPPVISFDVGLLANNFFSFESSGGAGGGIEEKKADLINNWSLLLSDNDTIDPETDVSLFANVTSSLSTCYSIFPVPLNMNCAGQHTIRLSAKDMSENETIFAQDIDVYVYDASSKTAFDQMISKSTTQDAAGNYLSTFISGLSGYSTDPSNIISEIENLTLLNTVFDSNNPQKIANLLVLSYEQLQFTDASGTYDVKLDFSPTDGKYINFYVNENNQSELSFTRPYPMTKDVNKSTLEITTGEVTEIVRIKLEVGNYAELIRLSARVSPSQDPDEIQHLVIPIIHKYLVNPTDPRDFSLNPFGLEETAIKFYEKAVLKPSIFLNNNFSGLYKLSQLAKDVNNGVHEHGVSVLELDNSYGFDGTANALSEFILDSDGYIKERYIDNIVNHIGYLIDNVQSLNSSLKDGSVLDGTTITPRKVKVSLVVVDGELSTTIHNFEPKRYVNTALKSKIDTFNLATMSNATCNGGDFVMRTPRDYISLPLICLYNEMYYEPTGAPGVSSVGKFGYINESLYIGSSLDTTDAEGNDITIYGWCPIAQPNCASPNTTEIELLKEFEYPSYIYEPQPQENSNIINALVNPDTSLPHPYALSTISSGFINNIDELTSGDYLSKYIFDKSIPKINYQTILSSHLSAEVPTLAYSLSSPYTYPFEEDFSFTSSGFINKTDSEAKIGSNPSNFSAYDKFLTSPGQVIDLSLTDMKDNSKVYIYDLNHQSTGNNDQNILKINIWAGASPGVGQDEFFLIEKRVKSGADIIANVNDWDEDESGILVWHIENELGSTSVKKEGSLGVIFTSGFKLQPELSDPWSSTNTNEGNDTGIIIKVMPDNRVKICHVNAGSDPLADIYDTDCAVDAL